jgi:hypothetical protein
MKITETVLNSPISDGDPEFIRWKKIQMAAESFEMIPLSQINECEQELSRAEDIRKGRRMKKI